MQYRQLGKTGIEVSEIGFGAWGIGGGWGERDDKQALAALEKPSSWASTLSTPPLRMAKVTPNG